MRVLMIDGQAIRQRWEAVNSLLDERGRRLFAAAEVWAAGRGGLRRYRVLLGLHAAPFCEGLRTLTRLHCRAEGFAVKVAAAAGWRCVIRRF